MSSPTFLFHVSKSSYYAFQMIQILCLDLIIVKQYTHIPISTRSEKVTTLQDALPVFAGTETHIYFLGQLRIHKNRK